MYPLENKLEGWFRCSIVSEYPKRFSRPDDLAGGDPPTEAPGITEPLSFRRIRLASSKLDLGQLSFGVLGTQFFVGSFKFLNICTQIIPRQSQ